MLLIHQQIQSLTPANAPLHSGKILNAARSRLCRTVCERYTVRMLMIPLSRRGGGGLYRPYRKKPGQEGRAPEQTHRTYFFISFSVASISSMMWFIFCMVSCSG